MCNSNHNKTTFVTSYIRIYENDYAMNSKVPTFQDKLEQFLKMANTGVNICVFMDDMYFVRFSHIMKRHKNVYIINAGNYNDLSYVKQFSEQLEKVNLPNNRNEQKDSKKYLCLMNSKIDFVKQAIELNPFSNDYFGWVDFSLPYIFRFSETVTNLITISKQTYVRSFLFIPGCWNFKIKHTEQLTNHIVWRFCGGFFLGDKNTLLDFYNVSFNNVELFFKETNTLVWEVNYWAWLEANNRIHPIWTLGNHDDSILHIPNHFNTLLTTVTDNV